MTINDHLHALKGQANIVLLCIINLYVTLGSNDPHHHTILLKFDVGIIQIYPIAKHHSAHSALVGWFKKKLGPKLDPYSNVQSYNSLCALILWSLCIQSTNIVHTPLLNTIIAHETLLIRASPAEISVWSCIVKLDEKRHNMLVWLMKIILAKYNCTICNGW
jgi:hypothetical protein